MVALVKFTKSTEDIANAVHDFDSVTLKVALSNVAPVAASNTVLADITQIAAANGYVAGGNAIANVSVTRSGNVTSVAGDDVVFQATGVFGPFRYVILYNDTAANDPLIAFADRGSSITLGDGDRATIDFTGPFITIS